MKIKSLKRLITHFKKYESSIGRSISVNKILQAELKSNSQWIGSFLNKLPKIVFTIITITGFFSSQTIAVGATWSKLYFDSTRIRRNLCAG